MRMVLLVLRRGLALLENTLTNKTLIQSVWISVENALQARTVNRIASYITPIITIKLGKDVTYVFMANIKTWSDKPAAKTVHRI